MGMLLCGALVFGVWLIVTAPESIYVVYDLSGCYAPPPVPQPCERVAYKAGTMNMMFNAWCGALLLALAAWLLWELWNAVAPRPITDDFLKLLDHSFGRNWRDPRTWPWTRLAWAYGFTLAGAALAAMVLVSANGWLARGPGVPHVETSQQLQQVSSGK
jgi:hypothetical protein